MRITEILKILSKQTLPFRGHRNKAVYTLDNEMLNHGNILATVQLMEKCDPIMEARFSAVPNKMIKTARTSSN